MGEERKKILGLVAAGKITIEEAEALLEALGKNNTLKKEDSMETATAQPQTKKNLKYLRVLVTSTGGDNVNVRIPVALLRAGIKLSSLMPKEAYDQINRKIAEHGMNIDLNNLKSMDLEELIESMGEMNVDVNSAQGDTVKVFFE